MFFDLRHVRGDREHVQRTLTPADFGPEDADYEIAGPVHLAVDVEKAGADVYRVTGRVSTRLTLECSRCVEPFALPVDADFELRYVPETAETIAAADADREVTEDDLTTAFYREGAIDLLHLIREQFQLALPMKPLCISACRGLCVVCGTNQNRSTCACHPAWTDPRLAALKGLLDRH